MARSSPSGGSLAMRSCARCWPSRRTITTLGRRPIAGVGSYHRFVSGLPVSASRSVGALSMLSEWAADIFYVHRVPLRNRSGHQRISPDVQTGCISCCSGDGKFGAPIWWNTPVDDDDVEAEASQQHRSQWTQPVGPHSQILSCSLF